MPVRRVPLPPQPGWGLTALSARNAPLMEPLTYAVDEAEYGRGRMRGMFVLSPGDVRGLAYAFELAQCGCCGFDGRYGLCAECARCGTLVAARTDDCDMPSETRFAPDGVVLEDCGADPEAAPDPFPRCFDWDDEGEGDYARRNPVPRPPESRQRPEMRATHWRIRGLRDEVYRDDPPA